MKSLQNAAATPSLASTAQSAVGDDKEKGLDHPLASACDLSPDTILWKLELGPKATLTPLR